MAPVFIAQRAIEVIAIRADSRACGGQFRHSVPLLLKAYFAQAVGAQAVDCLFQVECVSPCKFVRTALEHRGNNRVGNSYTKMP